MIAARGGERDVDLTVGLMLNRAALLRRWICASRRGRGLRGTLCGG